MAVHLGTPLFSFAFLSVVIPLAISLWMGAPTSAIAAEVYSAIIRPTPSSNGASGAGIATLTLDGTETELSFTITYEGLTSAEIGAHIHRPGGDTAFTLPTTNPKVGVWQSMGFSDVLQLKNERLYILIHTESNPGGELRGDIVAGPPVATEASSFGAVKALYGESSSAR